MLRVALVAISLLGVGSIVHADVEARLSGIIPTRAASVDTQAVVPSAVASETRTSASLQATSCDPLPAQDGICNRKTLGWVNFGLLMAATGAVAAMELLACLSCSGEDVPREQTTPYKMGRWISGASVFSAWVISIINVKDCDDSRT